MHVKCINLVAQHKTYISLYEISNKNKLLMDSKNNFSVSMFSGVNVSLLHSRSSNA